MCATSYLQASDQEDNCKVGRSPFSFVCHFMLISSRLSVLKFWDKIPEKIQQQLLEAGRESLAQQLTLSIFTNNQLLVCKKSISLRNCLYVQQLLEARREYPVQQLNCIFHKQSSACLQKTIFFFLCNCLFVLFFSHANTIQYMSFCDTFVNLFPCLFVFWK